MIIAWKVVVTVILFALLYSTFSVADLPPGSTAALQTQTDALLAFKNALADPKALESWSGTEPCSGRWQGITCSSDKSSVVKMFVTAPEALSHVYQSLQLFHASHKSLQGSKFYGPIPKEIKGLDFLESFVVANTAFKGQLPAAIENLKKLETLIISRNPHLSGEFPDGIFNLKNIKRLDLSWNNLTGFLPGSPPLASPSLPGSSGSSNMNWSNIFPPDGAKPSFPLPWNDTTKMPTIDWSNVTAGGWEKNVTDLRKLLNGTWPMPIPIPSGGIWLPLPMPDNPFSWTFIPLNLTMPLPSTLPLLNSIILGSLFNLTWPLHMNSSFPPILNFPFHWPLNATIPPLFNWPWPAPNTPLSSLFNWTWLPLNGSSVPPFNCNWPPLKASSPPLFDCTWPPLNDTLAPPLFNWTWPSTNGTSPPAWTWPPLNTTLPPVFNLTWPTAPAAPLLNWTWPPLNASSPPLFNWTWPAPVTTPPTPPAAPLFNRTRPSPTLTPPSTLFNWTWPTPTPPVPTPREVVRTSRRGPSFKNLPHLKYLDLSHNAFLGAVPEGLEKLMGLYYLNLSNNFLFGGTPFSLFGSPHLTNIDLSSNFLSGNIESAAQFAKSITLNISDNCLTGVDPSKEFAPDQKISVQDNCLNSSPKCKCNF